MLATYLLHLVERRLVDAELFEVILRRLDHPLDDLQIDLALLWLLACCLLSLTHAPPCVAGVLTTALFDMAILPRWLCYRVGTLALLWICFYGGPRAAVATTKAVPGKGK